jgi:hypothetical protein
MSESTPWILDEEPPPPRFELPRLQIIHLMMWMAATAAAFLPYRVQRESMERISAGAAQQQESTTALAMAAWYGVLQGAHLFVAAAVLAWRRRGYTERLQPGHCFAFQGAVYWLISALTWVIISTVIDDSFGWYAIYSLPHGLAALAFFVWFLKLARRPDWPAYWRQAFAAAALVPVLSWVLMMVLSFTIGFGRSPARVFTLMGVTQGGAAVLLTAILGRALYRDYREAAPRHWSHWIGAGARWAESASFCLYYVALCLNPPALGV